MEEKLFNTIVNFVSELENLYGSKDKQLVLYHHLLKKTKFTDKYATSKNIEAFKKFCTENKEKILDQTLPFDNATIFYSKKVFLDLDKLIGLADKDKENKDTIWSYLLTFLAIIDPSSGAKDKLKNKQMSLITSNNKKDKSKEFIEDIMDDVKNNINPETEDPMAAASSVFASGILPKLMGGLTVGIEDGSLNLNGLLGTLQSMLNEVKGQVSDDDKCFEAINMANNLLNNLKDEESSPSIEEIE